MTRPFPPLRLTATIAWLGLIFFSSGSAAQPVADIEAVKAASKAFYAALSVIDNGEALDKVVAHTPYITFASPRKGTIGVGHKAWKAYWAESNALFSARKVALVEQHIHVSGNLAWEMGQESGTMTFKDGKISKVDFIVTNVYEKLDGRWRLVSHHVQPKPP